MTTGRRGKEKPVEDGRGGSAPDSLVADLARMFADLPRRVVVDEVDAAANELHGQVSTASMDELLHRLAAYRLGRRTVLR